MRSADTPSVIACGDATFPKGTASAVAAKFSGTAQRRPLGGAGCERSEQTEGVGTLPLFLYTLCKKSTGKLRRTSRLTDSRIFFITA